MTEKIIENTTSEEVVVPVDAAPVAAVTPAAETVATGNVAVAVEPTDRPVRGARGGQNNRGGKPGGRTGGRPPRAPREKPEFDSKTISIRRVTRVVSGGRRFALSVAITV